MPNTFVLIALALISSSAHAASLNPCTPRVQGAPTYIHCDANRLKYSIVVETLMSPPLPMCRGPNRIEYKTAKIRILTSPSQAHVANLEIFHNGFTYNLDVAGASRFDSELLGLHLDRCTISQNGSFLVDN